MVRRWKWVILAVFVAVIAGPIVLRAFQPKPWDGVEAALPTVTLGPDIGGPREIGSMCLGVTASGPGLIRTEIVGALTTTLGLIGVEVVDRECDVSLAVRVGGNRLSAAYSGSGVCWSGLALEGEVSLSIDSHEARTWTHQIDEPPPDWVSYCLPDRDEPLRWGLWHDELIGAPLGEMFGELGGLAVYFGFRQPYESGDVPTDRPANAWPLTPVGVQAVAAWITADPAMLDDFEGLAPWVRRGGDTAIQITPYLIALMTPDCTGIPEECERWNARAERLLGEIYSYRTGYASPKSWNQAQWWTWWKSISGEQSE